MSSRRAMSMPPAAYERSPKKRNRCTSFICMSWKVFTVVFSYVSLVTLVVAYCMFGAYMFSYLESQHELEVSYFLLIFLIIFFFCISTKIMAFICEQKAFHIYLTQTFCSLLCRLRKPFRISETISPRNFGE